MRKTRTWLFILCLLGFSLSGCATREAREPIAPLEPEQPAPPISTSQEEGATAAAPAPTATPEPVATTIPKPTEEPHTELSPSTAAANADVLFVRATETAVALWTFTVEVAHPDTGWEDYADGWDVVLPDGTVAKANPDDPFTRLLLHPHENEQPFTRSQSNVPIPAGVTTVTVRAHDLVDGFGGQEVIVNLTQAAGQQFEVIRLEQ